MLSICELFICHYLRFQSSFRKLMMKTLPNIVFRHVEHLRMLHMNLFAVLEQIIKLDDENTQKRVFRHVEHLRTLHMPLLLFLEQMSKVIMKTEPNSVFGIVSICECCICHYLRFQSRFQKLMMKTQPNSVLRHAEHLRQLQRPLFAFLEQILILNDENTLTTLFSAS